MLVGQKRLSQAALYGLQRSVREIGMPLLSVNRVKPGQAEAKARHCNASLSFKQGGKNADNEQDHRKER
jgi:hypothetical protein